MRNINDHFTFLIDFLNIAYYSKINGKPRLSNYELVKEQLIKLYPEVKIYGIADPKTPYVIDEKIKYEKFVNKGEIIQVGPKEQADYYMIKYAEKDSFCFLITNDSFKDYRFNDGLKERIIPFCIINDKVIFSKKLKNVNYSMSRMCK